MRGRHRIDNEVEMPLQFGKRAGLRGDLEMTGSQPHGVLPILLRGAQDGHFSAECPRDVRENKQGGRMT